MKQIKITRYDFNPQWDTMEIKQKHSDWSICSHGDGDVEIECTTSDGSNHLFLSQDELKQLIQFLNEKVIR
jgi:hypothetical protein